MAKAWLCRSEGNFILGNETAYGSISEKIKQTIPSSTSTTFSILAGMSTASYGTPYDARSQLLVGGVQKNEVMYYPAIASQASSYPVIWPFQNTSAANFDIQEQASNLSFTNGAVGFGIGPTGLFTTDRTGISYINSATEITKSTSGFTDGQSLTFTPASTQDYLIVASGRLRNIGTSNAQPQAQLVIDGTAYGLTDLRTAGTGDYLPFTFVKKINLTNASHTAKLQYQAADNFWNIGMSNQSIMAIPLSGYTTAYNEGTTPATVTTWADIASATIAPVQSSTYLIIAAGELTGSSATQGIRLNINGTIYSQQLTPLMATSQHLAFGMLTAVIVASGSQTVKLQAQNATVTNGKIFAIDLTADAQELQVCYGQGVNASADDAEENTTAATINLTGTRNNVGKNITPQTIDYGWRFNNVDLKQGATVDSCWLDIAFFSAGTAYNLNPVFFNEDNTATFSTSANFTGRSVTTGVTWTPGTISQDHFQESSDLHTILQTVANRAGFAQFNSVGGKLQGANAATNNVYSVENYDAAVPLSPEIKIRWKETLPIPMTQISVTDSGTGSDSGIAVQANIPVTDAGSGNDNNVAITNTFPLSDANSSVVETPTIQANLPLNDANALATDTVAYQQLISVGDNNSFNLHFNGTTDQTLVGLFPQKNDEITVEVLVNQDAYVSGKRAIAVTSSWEVDFEGDRIKLRIYGSAGSTFFDLGTYQPSLNAGNWTHVVFVSSLVGGFIKGYINGVLTTTITTGLRTDQFTTGSQNFYLGRYSAGGQWNGFIGRARVYNTALSNTDALNLYNNVAIRTGLVAEYLFQEGSGATLKDTTGSWNQAITGATWQSGVQETATPFISVPVTDSGSGAESTPSILNSLNLNEGLSESALNFAGVDAQTTFTPTTAPTTTQNQIMSGWFQLGADGINSAISQPPARYGNIYFQLRNSTNTVQLRYDETTAHITGTANLGTGDRRWHHMLGIYEWTGGTNVTLWLYIDGVLSSSNSYTVLPTSNRGYGLAQLGGGFFNGALKKWRFWKNIPKPTADQVRTLYLTDVPWATPDHEFLLNDGSGTTTADTGSQGNNATISGTRWQWAGNSIPGTFGGVGSDAMTNIQNNLALADSTGSAATFSGTNSYGQIPFNSTINQSVFTFMAWVKRNTNGGNQTINGREGSNGPQFRFNASNQLELLKENTISIGTSTPNTVTADGNAHLVAVSYDSSGNFQFYIDGNPAGNGTNLQTFTFSGTLNIGIKQTTAQEAFNGIIGNWKMYNRVLTSTEVSNAYAGSPPTDYIVDLEMNEGSGNIFEDNSTNGLHANTTGITYVRPIITTSGLFTDVLTSILATIPLTDSGSGSENVSITSTIPLSDSGHGVDTVAPLNLISLNESAVGSDTLSLLLAMLTLTDSGSGADSVLVQILLIPVTVSDSGSGSDTMTILANIGLSDNNTSVNEALAVVTAIALSDSGNATEALSFLVTLALSDSALASDAVAILSTFALSDSGHGTDTLALLASITLSEGGAGSDVLTSILATIPINDSGTGTDALSLFINLALSDSATGQEALSILTTFALSDSAVASDAIAIMVTLALADSALASDVVSVLGLFNFNDSGSGSESVSILSSIPLADSGHGAEAVALLVTMLLSDNGSGADSVSINANLTLLDNGSGSDTVTILASIPISDNAHGVDTLSLFIQIPVSDSGVGSEVVSILNQFNLTDNGSGADNVNVQAFIALLDSAVGTEDITITANVPINDSGVGSEQVGISVQLRLIDGMINVSLIWDGNYNLSFPYRAGYDVTTTFSVAFWTQNNFQPAPSSYWPIVQHGSYQQQGWNTFLINGNTTGMKTELRLNNAPAGGGMNAASINSNIIDFTYPRHVVITYNNGVVRHYVDGQFSFTSTMASPYNANIPYTGLINIGTEGGRTYQGWTRDIKLWNSVLTDDEIYDFYRRNNVPQTGNLIMDIPMNEGTGSAKEYVQNTTGTNSKTAIWSYATTGGVTGFGLDSFSILASIALSDTALGNDTLSILASIALSDSAHGVDALAFLISLALTDSGIASDVVALTIFFLLQDSGISHDTMSILVNAVLNDSALAHEALNLLINVNLSENANALDTVAQRRVIDLFDSGLSNDGLSVRIFQLQLASKHKTVLQAIDKITPIQLKTHVSPFRENKHFITLQTTHNKTILKTRWQK